MKMIVGASQAVIAFIMSSAGGNFITKGKHKADGVQGQMRRHSRLSNVLGVKRIAIGVSKMGYGVAGCNQSRYDVTSNERKSMLIKAKGAGGGARARRDHCAHDEGALH